MRIADLEAHNAASNVLGACRSAVFTSLGPGQTSILSFGSYNSESVQIEPKGHLLLYHAYPPGMECRTQNAENTKQVGELKTLYWKLPGTPHGAKGQNLEIETRAGAKQTHRRQ